MKMSMWNRRCEKLDRRKINRKNINKVMNNMMLMKNEDKKKSRTLFYDNVVENKKPSYEKDFSFLFSNKKPKTRPYKPINEDKELDFYTELDQIIRELDESC